MMRSGSAVRIVKPSETATKYLCRPNGAYLSTLAVMDPSAPETKPTWLNGESQPNWMAKTWRLRTEIHVTVSPGWTIGAGGLQTTSPFLLMLTVILWMSATFFVGIFTSLVAFIARRRAIIKVNRLIYFKQSSSLLTT
jgi:hypothetical protein